MLTKTKAIAGAAAVPAALLAPAGAAGAAPVHPPGVTVADEAPKDLSTLTLADLSKLSNVEISETLVSATSGPVTNGVTDRTAVYKQDIQVPGYTTATMWMSIHWQFDGKKIIGNPSVGQWEDVNFPVCVIGRSTIAEFLYNDNADFLSDRRLNVGLYAPWGCASGGSATIQAHVNGAGNAWTV